MRMRYFRGLVVVISCGMWFWSLQLPAILFRLVGRAGSPSQALGTETYTGLNMLISSIFGAFFMNFAGVANLLWVIGCFCLLRNRMRDGRISLSVALVLTLQTFQMYWIKFPFDEAGVRNGLLLHPLSGWYLWVASIALPLVASFLCSGQQPAR